MSKLKIFTIHDQAVKEYLGIELHRTPGEAERKFRFNVNNKETGFLHTNPEHYTLMAIGEYDTETGKIRPTEPETVITALQAKDTNVGAND